MTFAELQTDVEDIVQDWTNHGDYTTTKRDHYINLGNRQFAKQAKCISGVITITTVANQLEYTQSDQANLQYLYMPRSVRYVDGDELGRPLDPYPGGYHNLPRTLIYGIPYWYVIENLQGRSIATGSTGSITRTGVKFYGWPISAENTKYYQINAYLFPATLSVSTHTPEYDEAWHDAPVHWAAYRILRMFSEKYPETRAKALEQKALFDELVDQAKAETTTQQLGPMQVMDWETEKGDW